MTPKVMIKTTMTSILSKKCPIDTSLAALNNGKIGVLEDIRSYCDDH